MNTILKTLLLASFGTVCSAQGAIDKKPKAGKAPSSVKSAPDTQQPKWLLKNFAEMVHSEPDRILKIAGQLFSEERLRVTSVEPGLAHEWQHRLAMVSALSEFFNPTVKRKSSNFAIHRLKARGLVTRALSADPSLLVRDGAVESIRRIFQMQPGEAKLWRKPLETAFLSGANIMDGEGFFIRETILTAMREGGLSFSKPVRTAALRDKNAEVRNLIKNKSTAANNSTWQFTGQAR